MPKRTVYLVDDDQAVLDSTAFLLDAFGIGWQAFANPAEFLAQLDRLVPGCIVTDLRMPQMSGWELGVAVRERAIGWPMLLMTSDGTDQVEALARVHGFQCLLRKPVPADTLVDALEAGFALLETPPAPRAD